MENSVGGNNQFSLFAQNCPAAGRGYTFNGNVYDATYIGGNCRTRNVWREAGTDYGFALQYGISDPDVRCEFTGHADDRSAIGDKSRLFRSYSGDRDSGCCGGIGGNCDRKAFYFEQEPERP